MAKKVQFTKDHNGHAKGEVLTVDDNSAQALVKAGVATEYDGKADIKPPTPKPGVVHIVQVADADPGPAKPKKTSSDVVEAPSPKATAR